MHTHTHTHIICSYRCVEFSSQVAKSSFFYLFNIPDSCCFKAELSTLIFLHTGINPNGTLEVKL